MSSSRYPTKGEILARMQTMDITPYKAITFLWKNEKFTNRWKTKTNSEKIADITHLLYRLYHSDTERPIMFVLPADRYAYHVPSNTIILNQDHPSIISALHELGHALYGTSELEACAFSVKMFSEVFPNQYNKLTWSGHKLIKS